MYKGYRYIYDGDFIIEMALESEEETYDPFQIQDSGKMTHIMSGNGTLYGDYPDEMCCCSHMTSEHLDCESICLSPKCLCLNFVLPGQLATIISKRTTLSKPQKQASDLQITT